MGGACGHVKCCREEYDPRTCLRCDSGQLLKADIKEAITFLQEADFFADISSSEFCDDCFAKRIIGDYINMLPDINAVREALENTGIGAYEWNDNPVIRNKLY